MKVRAIVALTESGATPLWMSRIRSDIPVYAFTRHEATRRRVTLYRGVYPVIFDVTCPDNSTESLYRALFVLLLAALALGWLLLRASLPRLDGALAASGLTGAVRITRDSRGVPTIEATDRADLVYATGFVHAQDRYFQMDLSRRLAAGELAELFGGAALEQDR